MSISYIAPGREEHTRFEKIHNVIFSDWKASAKEICQELQILIEQKNAQGQKCLIALEASTRLVFLYREIVHLYKKGLDFSQVLFFSTGEYYPVKKTSTQSCYHFLYENLFSYLNLPEENICLLEGEVSPENLSDYCQDYENLIEEKGGLDCVILGVGRLGQISFNEAGSSLNSVIRCITLSHETRANAEFLEHDNPIRRAFSLGLQTILHAKRVLLLGHGNVHPQIVRRLIEEKATEDFSASLIQHHPNATFILDEETACELTKQKTPWLVRLVNWNRELTYKAVIWLCEKTQKSILKLTNKDYNTHGLSSLLESENTIAYDLNIRIFNQLHKTITGWPGGKPNVDDSHRPERAHPAQKRVIIFSPHPDDDVISMGGTFDRLVEQGHEVHVAYQTSGNIAVSRTEALRYIEVANTLQPNQVWESFMDDLNTIDEGETSNTLAVKGMIRRYESFGVTRFFEVPDERVHFLDLPFYETGQIKKKPLGMEDIEIIKRLVEKVKPHQIYAAGDLADPHGTHKVCLDAIFKAIDELKNKEFMKSCWVWLYRGAWHEWDIHDIDMAVAMSPDQVLRKRKAIFFHQSQKDGTMFQGNDAREFWVRTEERNRTTARRYRDLGFADYAALEAFKRYHFSFHGIETSSTPLKDD